MIPRFFLLVSLTCLVACQHKQATTTPESNSEEEARYHKVGLITLPDLWHASAWEKLIHVDMGVPASKIEVQAGPGFTTVTIRDLNNRADIEGVAQELRAIAEKKPDKFGVTKVEVRLNSAPATINPFTLPTESAPATPNPSSVLPTLSLPPFRIDGR
ncbi:MAG: hypothetical protein NTY98_28560 [Verrucomicrobia bacterium]|nr:hypothetical protein [Verrucomicrobiota bacterium]